MTDENMYSLIDLARKFNKLTIQEEEKFLMFSRPLIGRVDILVDSFYYYLFQIPEAKSLLEHKSAKLKTAHTKWMINLLITPITLEYAWYLYDIGSVHAVNSVPVEFITGSSTILNHLLITQLTNINLETVTPILAMVGFNIFIIQHGFQNSIKSEIQKLLRIIGISDTPYTNALSLQIGDKTDAPID